MIRLNYFCAVEGQQEEMYLKHISSLLRDYPERVVKFNSIIGNANELKKRDVAYGKVCLFDHDCNKEEFENNLKLCLKLDAERKKNDAAVNHAYSSICFDLWLVLHKKFVGRSAVNAKEHINDVREVYFLPKEADIKCKDIIEQILAQITLEDVKTAIHNAERIRKSKLDNSKWYVTDTDYYYPDPYFSIDIFLKMVLEKSGIDIYTT